MKIGMVGESFKEKDGKHCFSENFDCLIEHLSESNNEFYLLNHHLKPYSSNIFPAINIHSQKETPLDVSSLDVVYFGKTGKNILKYNQTNSVVEQLGSFLGMMEYLLPFEDSNGGNVRFVNPSNTLISNINKQYLIDLLNNTDLPIISSERIDSVERLVDLSEQNSKYLVKPLISERSGGAMIVNGKSEDELVKYFDKYNQDVQGNDLYSRVMSHQGIIAQPYVQDFSKFGERKVGVIDGKVTLGRKIIGSNDDIVSFQTGADYLDYSPTKEESDLAIRTFHEFNKFFPANYLRVDLTGKPGNLMINEIEALNPNFGDMDFSDKMGYHNSLLEQTLASGVNVNPCKLILNPYLKESGPNKRHIS